MNRDNEKRVTPDIDEQKIMDFMAADGVSPGGFKVPAETPAESSKKEKPVTGERGQVKENSQPDYGKIFFKEVKSTARHGKSVYINPDHHKKLTRIVQVIAEDNITIYAYLSNLLEYHFQEFGEQITTNFNEKYKPIL